MVVDSSLTRSGRRLELLQEDWVINCWKRQGGPVIFDFVEPSGPQMQYGMIDPEEGWIGISDRLASGERDFK